MVAEDLRDQGDPCLKALFGSPFINCMVAIPKGPPSIGNNGADTGYDIGITDTAALLCWQFDMAETVDRFDPSLLCRGGFHYISQDTSGEPGLCPRNMLCFDDAINSMECAFSLCR